MRKIWINKPQSFKEAERFEGNYYLKMTAAMRLDTMQLLREIYYKIKSNSGDENRKRLRRVVKVIQ